jgi:UDP-2-acetamido-3-amino-2,3-dideoxy-glucuronate N-acetyltransferase
MSANLPAVVASDRGPGLYIQPGVVIPADTVLAPHVTIYAAVEIGAGVSVGQGSILGRPHQRDPGSRSVPMPPTLTTRIGDGCMLGSGVVVGAGATLLAGSRMADNAAIGGGAVMEEGSMLGRGSGIGNYARIGQRTRIQNDVIIGPGSRVAADVFISPRVTLVGDPTMGRRAPVGEPSGVVLGRACRIGTAAIIVPPVEVGEEAVVAVAALVRRDVPPRTVVAGSPARVVREVREDELLEVWT